MDDSGCTDHDDHDNFEVVLAAETLENFVALLHMKSDGTWELIENADVTGEGTHLTFTVDSFSPFAIVVNTNPKLVSEQESSSLWVIIVVCVSVVGAGGGAAAYFYSVRKKK